MESFGNACPYSHLLSSFLLELRKTFINNSDMKRAHLHPFKISRISSLRDSPQIAKDDSAEARFRTVP